MRTANNLLRRVHNYTHFNGLFTQFQRKCNILEIFHHFHILNVSVRCKNGKFQSPKSSTATSISVKSLIPRWRALCLLSKSVFKTMGNLKENFWGQKIQVVLFIVIHSLTKARTKHSQWFFFSQFSSNSIVTFKHFGPLYPDQSLVKRKNRVFKIPEWLAWIGYKQSLSARINGAVHLY